MGEGCQKLVLAPVGIAQRRIADTQRGVELQFFHRFPGSLGDQIDQRYFALVPFVGLRHRHDDGRD